MKQEKQTSKIVGRRDIRTVNSKGTLIRLLGFLGLSNIFVYTTK